MRSPGPDSAAPNANKSVSANPVLARSRSWEITWLLVHQSVVQRKPKQENPHRKAAERLRILAGVFRLPNWTLARWCLADHLGLESVGLNRGTPALWRFKGPPTVCCCFILPLALGHGKPKKLFLSPRFAELVFAAAGWAVHSSDAVIPAPVKKLQSVGYRPRGIAPRRDYSYTRDGAQSRQRSRS